MLGAHIGLELAARIDAVQLRHHDVHQDDVRLFGQRLVDGVFAIHRRDDVEVFVPELVGQQLPVLFDVIDDEDACTHLAALREDVGRRRAGLAVCEPVRRFTSLMNADIWIGFVM